MVPLPLRRVRVTHKCDDRRKGGNIQRRGIARKRASLKAAAAVPSRSLSSSRWDPKFFWCFAWAWCSHTYVGLLAGNKRLQASAAMLLPRCPAAPLPRCPAAGPGNTPNVDDGGAAVSCRCVCARSSWARRPFHSAPLPVPPTPTLSPALPRAACTMRRTDRADPLRVSNQRPALQEAGERHLPPL